MLLSSKNLSIERLTIPITGLPADLSGIKLVQLSDIHYDGECISEELLAKTIDISNQEEPDLIILTGDYVTDIATPIHQLVHKLKYLESRLGIYACLGNHDNYNLNCRTEIIAAFTKINATVLWNAIAYPLGNSFPIVGLADYWSKEFAPEPIMSQLDPQLPRIVLSHNPDSAAILQKWRVDLQLSGHTHGGQFVLPGLGVVPKYINSLKYNTPKSLQKLIPFLGECSRVLKHWEWASGLHQVGDNLLYVNRGLGSYPPGRLFCPPELTVITLASK